MTGRRGDDGQVTILVIGFVVVALALVAVVASAAQVHLERARLAALADFAALAAAEQVSDEAYYAPSDQTPGETPGETPGVSSGGACEGTGPDCSSCEGTGPGCSSDAALGPTGEEAMATVRAYLADHPDPAARWTDLRVLAVDSDGRTVRVTLGAVVRPAWTAWVLAPFTDGIAVTASSDASAW